MAASTTELERKVIARRRKTGADRYDEVWEGVYVTSPLANNEHQDVVGGLTSVLRFVIQWAGLGVVFPGANISDREDDWMSNFRRPDVAVFLNDTQAENCDTFWFGGPDLAVEIVSPGDRTREKLDFYAQTATRELLVVDRNPWTLELYRLHGGVLQSVGTSTSVQQGFLASEVVPLSFRLVAGDKRPAIGVRHADGRQEWTV